jgi:hypothetical protein
LVGQRPGLDVSILESGADLHRPATVLVRGLKVSARVGHHGPELLQVGVLHRLGFPGQESFRLGEPTVGDRLGQFRQVIAGQPDRHITGSSAISGLDVPRVSTLSGADALLDQTGPPCGFSHRLEVLRTKR